MPSPLLNAGAQLENAPKYVPLHVNRWWTGLWTNRSVLRDAASTYLIEKFYAGARFESMTDGRNIEISPRLTPIRRPGNPVYNSQIFPPINDFYAFRVFNTKTFAEAIHVMADTGPNVYDATGPNTKTSILAKAAGSTQTSFQSVGNALYMADGIDLKKWIYQNRWTANTLYTIGDKTLDSNGDTERVLSASITTVGAYTVQVASNILSVVFETTSTPQIMNLLGSTVYLLLGTFTAANLVPFIVTSFVFNGVLGLHLNYTMQMQYAHADYGPAADSGKLFASVSGFLGTSGLPQVNTGTSGSSEPSWATSPGITNDNNALLWEWHKAVIDWQPIGPAIAPIVSNVPNTNVGIPWVANTFYNPSLLIIDSNSNLQLLTTAGTTGTVPVWATSAGTTTDGSAVWTFRGTATRATSHAYALSDVIQVTFTVVIVIPPPPKQQGGGNIQPNQDGSGGDVIILGPYTDTFKCTTPGTSSAQATGNIKWANGIGSKVTDGTVVWTNQGASITRTASATSATNIGNSQLVSLDQQIVDSNGNFENLASAGKSNATVPTWATTSGKTTVDNLVTWLNGGPATAANTTPWVYGFGFKNSITGGVSESSPKSAPIILNATSLISVSGNGDLNWATDGVDTIQIYRSTLGFTTLFLLAEIPAPLNGGPWSYLDNSPDPPDQNSQLNEFEAADVSGINAPPPAGMTGLSYYLNRIWGIVGSFVYYSSGPQQSIGVNTDNWPGENSFQFPSTVTRLFPSPTGMIFFTNQGLYLSVGTDGNGNPSQPIPFLETIGLLSTNCFTVNGSNPILFTGDRQLINLDPGSGVSRIGFPIEDQLQSFDPTLSYVTWHTKGPDQAAYIADGSGKWFRLNMTPAPETGSYCWSPAAFIVGGCKCVKSIETAPGVRDLLLGPASSGKILKRDSSTNQDNGVSYPADFTVGAIVFAQPGQAADIEFVTTEELPIGSTVSIGVLADEISGTPETMTLPVQDPVWTATPSVSIRSLRWYFGPMITPSWMRYAMFKFSWPTENFANELLSYSPVAALRQDAGTGT